MPKAVLDSSVLVSAFLTKAGVSVQLLRHAQAGTFRLCLAPEILEETQRVLLEYSRIRKRYHYTDQTALDYVRLLSFVAEMITELPPVKAVPRDPNDDMVIACAVKAKASYLVTRDKDLLSLGGYEQIQILSSEKFLGVCRR